MKIKEDYGSKYYDEDNNEVTDPVEIEKYKAAKLEIAALEKQEAAIHKRLEELGGQPVDAAGHHHTSTCFNCYT